MPERSEDSPDPTESAAEFTREGLRRGARKHAGTTLGRVCLFALRLMDERDSANRVCCAEMEAHDLTAEALEGCIYRISQDSTILQRRPPTRENDKARTALAAWKESRTPAERKMIEDLTGGDR